MSEKALSVGMIMFPGITQLDLTGPLEVLSSVPDWKVELVAHTMAPVVSGRGFKFPPTQTFHCAPQYELLVVPGGPGVDVAILDEPLITFVRKQALGARYVFGICTGSLILGAAGLLNGRRASTHWQAVDFLSSFGAIASHERMTVDGSLFTSGGVTAGIDMALEVVGKIAGADVAQGVQLLLEYDPAPPFNAGTPRSAPKDVVDKLQAASSGRYADRADAVRKAAERLSQSAVN
jgi:cyclohexyl-isocyanide hydratase